MLKHPHIVELLETYSRWVVGSQEEVEILEILDWRWRMWRYRIYWTGGGGCGYIGLEVECVEINKILDWRWRVWRYRIYWTGGGGCGYIGLEVECV